MHVSVSINARRLPDCKSLLTPSLRQSLRFAYATPVLHNSLLGWGPDQMRGVPSLRMGAVFYPSQKIYRDPGGVVHTYEPGYEPGMKHRTNGMNWGGMNRGMNG